MPHRGAFYPARPPWAMSPPEHLAVSGYAVCRCSHVIEGGEGLFKADCVQGFGQDEVRTDDMGRANGRFHVQCSRPPPKWR